MILFLEVLGFVRQSDNIIKEITIPSIIPARANETHEVRCKDRRLARYDASPKLLPQIIHHIKLAVGATMLVGEIHKISKIAINLINTTNLGIEDFSVNAKKNAIYWTEVLLRAIHHFAGLIDISHERLNKGLWGVVSPEVSFRVVRKHRVAQTSGELSPSAMQHATLGQPSHCLVIIIVNIHGGKELVDDIHIVRMMKLHQRDETKLLTNLPSLCEILSILVHVSKVDVMHGSNTIGILSI
jgi:hypothetical protein